jgi:hypothetical protein
LRSVIYHALVAKISDQDLETLVRQQAETIAQQAQIIEQQAATITRLEADNRDLRDQLEVMHFRVSQMSRRIYGNVSERIVDDADQAYLPGFGPGLIADETVGNDDTDDDPDGGGGGRSRTPKQKKKRGGRLKLPDHLPRVERIIEPDAEARAQHPHADRLVKIREEVTEKLDYVAGGFQVVRLIVPSTASRTVTISPSVPRHQRRLCSAACRLIVSSPWCSVKNSICIIHCIGNKVVFSAPALLYRARRWPIGLEPRPIISHRLCRRCETKSTQVQ